MRTDQDTAYVLIGGPAHGEELMLRGHPEACDVDAELYRRTLATESAFYRYNSLLPKPALDAYRSAVRPD